MNNTNTAAAILANLTTKKNHWTIKHFMNPITMQEYIKEQKEEFDLIDASEVDVIFDTYEEFVEEYRSHPENRHKRNTGLKIPQLSTLEAAVFLLALYEHWQEKGFNPIPSCMVNSEWQKENNQVWRVQTYDWGGCDECREGYRFIEQLFGNSWHELPFVTKGTGGWFIEYEELKKFVYS